MKRERLHTVEVDDVLLERDWSSSTEGDDCNDDISGPPTRMIVSDGNCSFHENFIVWEKKSKLNWYMKKTAFEIRKKVTQN